MPWETIDPANDEEEVEKLTRDAMVKQIAILISIVIINSNVESSVMRTWSFIPEYCCLFMQTFNNIIIITMQSSHRKLGYNHNIYSPLLSVSSWFMCCRYIKVSARWLYSLLGCLVSACSHINSNKSVQNAN